MNQNNEITTFKFSSKTFAGIVRDNKCILPLELNKETYEILSKHSNITEYINQAIKAYSQNQSKEFITMDILNEKLNPILEKLMQSVPFIVQDIDIEEDVLKPTKLLKEIEVKETKNTEKSLIIEDLIPEEKIKHDLLMGMLDDLDDDDE